MELSESPSASASASTLSVFGDACEEEFVEDELKGGSGGSHGVDGGGHVDVPAVGHGGGVGISGGVEKCGRGEGIVEERRKPESGQVKGAGDTCDSRRSSDNATQ